MTKVNSEEKAPLLYYEIDDTIPKENGYFDSGRYRGINSGVTTVFTHFPDYIGTCWVVTAVSALVFFMMMLLILSTLTVTSLRLPRCVTAEDLNNDTVHLVHIHSPYHEVEKISFVQDIISLYPSFNIRILTLPGKEEKQNSILPSTGDAEINNEDSTIDKEITSSSSVTTPIKFKLSQRMKEIEETQLLLNMLMHGMFMDKTGSKILPPNIGTAKSTTENIKHVEDLSDLYPKISYENITYSLTFHGTPLETSYKYMNEKLQVFAIRVLQIWQYGGVSFDLQNADKIELKEFVAKESKHHHNFFISEKDMRNVWVDTVSVDDRAFHLESKVPCHVFFEQLLMILRDADRFTTVTDVMKKAIRSFCIHYPVNRENCKKYMTV